MITIVVAVWVGVLSPLSMSPPPDPGLPTLPPPYPTYITHPDGTRSTCTYDFSDCDWIGAH